MRAELALLAVLLITGCAAIELDLPTETRRLGWDESEYRSRLDALENQERRLRRSLRRRGPEAGRKPPRLEELVRAQAEGWKAFPELFPDAWDVKGGNHMWAAHAAYSLKSLGELEEAVELAFKCGDYTSGPQKTVLQELGGGARASQALPLVERIKEGTRFPAMRLLAVRTEARLRSKMLPERLRPFALGALRKIKEALPEEQLQLDETNLFLADKRGKAVASARVIGAPSFFPAFILSHPSAMFGVHSLLDDDGPTHLVYNPWRTPGFTIMPEAGPSELGDKVSRAWYRLRPNPTREAGQEPSDEKKALCRSLFSLARRIAALDTGIELRQLVIDGRFWNPHGGLSSFVSLYAEDALPEHVGVNRVQAVPPEGREWDYGQDERRAQHFLCDLLDLDTFVKPTLEEDTWEVEGTACARFHLNRPLGEHALVAASGHDVDAGRLMRVRSELLSLLDKFEAGELPLIEPLKPTERQRRPKPSEPSSSNKNAWQEVGRLDSRMNSLRPRHREALKEVVNGCRSLLEKHGGKSVEYRIREVLVEMLLKLDELEKAVSVAEGDTSGRSMHHVAHRINESDLRPERKVELLERLLNAAPGVGDRSWLLKKVAEQQARVLPEHSRPLAEAAVRKAYDAIKGVIEEARLGRRWQPVLSEDTHVIRTRSGCFLYSVSANPLGKAGRFRLNLGFETGEGYHLERKLAKPVKEKLEKRLQRIEKELDEADKRPLPVERIERRREMLAFAERLSERAAALLNEEVRVLSEDAASGGLADISGLSGPQQAGAFRLFLKGDMDEKPHWPSRELVRFEAAVYDEGSFNYKEPDQERLSLVGEEYGEYRLVARKAGVGFTCTARLFRAGQAARLREIVEEELDALCERLKPAAATR